MTSPQTLVPEIRFEGFSSAWNRCSVGDVASVLGGNAWKSSEYADDGDYLVVTIANVSGEVYIDDTIGNHISCESPNGYLLHEEDILVSLTGNVGRVSKMSNTSGLLNQRVGKVIPNQSNITPDYLFHALRNPIFEKAMIEAGQGAAQKNISNKDILAYSLVAPSEVKEQIDIANFLNSIDCLINLYQRKYDRLKNVKKSMLEKMFPRDGANVPEIRFAGFTDAWEQRKVTELLKNTSDAIKIGPFGSALKKNFFSDKGIKVYAQENAFSGDFSIGNYYISEAKYNELKSCELKPGDLVISMMGTVGACAIFPENAEKGIMNSHLLRLQFSEEVLPEYIMFLLRDSQIIRNQIDRLSVGSIMTGLSSTVVKKLVFPVPKRPEQQKIVELLKQLDNLITLHQRKCDKLKDLKNSLLQKMFV